MLENWLEQMKKNRKDKKQKEYGVIIIGINVLNIGLTLGLKK